MVLSACEPNRFVTGWIPYWDAADGQDTLADDDQAALLGEVSLMWHEAADSGNGAITTLTNTNLVATVAAIRASGLPVIPAIIDGNDSSDKGHMLTTLGDVNKRNAHVQMIVDLVMNNGYDGIDIDYESFPFMDGLSSYSPTHSPNWVAFISSLGSALHSRGKLLSVTVPAAWVVPASASCWAPTGVGTKTCGYTFYAQDQIAPHVDRLRLMAYDWSTSTPGPIAPMSWDNAVIAYSDSRVPNSRLQLGVPAYGRHWRTQAVVNEICPDGSLFTESIAIEQSVALFADILGDTGLQPTRDASGELKVTWTEQVTGPRTKPITPPVFPPPSTTIDDIHDPLDDDALQPAQRLGVPPPIVTCTVRHTVFMPDAESIRQRAQAAIDAGWSGIAIWALGYQIPAVFDTLAGVAPQRPNGAPGGLLDPVADGVASLRVTGWALHPEFDLPVATRLTITPTSGGAPVPTRTVTARIDRAGMPTGVGPFHGFDETYLLAPGTYDVCVTVVLAGGVDGPSLGCDSATVTAPP